MSKAGDDSNPRFVATGTKTFKIEKGDFIELGDFQVKIVGEISNEKLNKNLADRSKGWQWLCTCTCLLGGNLVTRYTLFYCHKCKFNTWGQLLAR